MASTFGSFEIAKSGMMTYNQALQVTFHNVANVETKGYSKQTANITSMVGNKSSMIAQGFGVTVTDISRSRNEYYDTKYQLTNTSYNRYKTEAYYLSALQDQICGNVTSDDKVNLTDAFDTFTDEYQAQNPLVAAANEYIEAGKESVAWCFTTMPSENWKNGVGSALLEYAQGTGDWDAVKTAFVDGWATEYAEMNSEEAEDATEADTTEAATEAATEAE